MRTFLSYLLVVAVSMGFVNVPHEMYYEHPELLFMGLTNRL